MLKVSKITAGLLINVILFTAFTAQERKPDSDLASASTGQKEQLENVRQLLQFICPVDSIEKPIQTDSIDINKPGYLVSDSNWQNLEGRYRSMYPELFSTILDSLLEDKKASEATKEKGYVQARLVMNRPVAIVNYHILNSVGVWLKKAQSHASGGSFESRFSGMFFQTMMFTLKISAAAPGSKTGVLISRLFYCMDHEYESKDQALIQFKQASLDLLEDNINSSARNDIIKFLKEVREKESDKNLLARVEKLITK